MKTCRSMNGVLAVCALMAALPLAATECPNEKGIADLPPGSGENLEVTGACRVERAGTYTYGNVNIYGKQGKKASLTFLEPTDGDKKIHFWATSILIESDGTLAAGSPGKAFGQGDVRNALLEIHLYGAATPTGTGSGDGGAGITCKLARCGIPTTVWDSDQVGLEDQKKVRLPGGVEDYFYRYAPLTYDDGRTDGAAGWFGTKVLGLSYNGTLALYGQKGATYSSLRKEESGRSWTRLAEGASILENATSLTVQGDDLGWQAGDSIVATTTDYLPGHSEERVIDGDPVVDRQKHTTTLKVKTAFAYHHNGDSYKLGPDRVPARLQLGFDKGETRAVVALLTRSIRVSSALTTSDVDGLPAGSFFGGHTVVRQGFEKFEVQGVEFRQLGQGGRIGHYPVHFHMARETPHLPNGIDESNGAMPGQTFLKDSSINESMTRWVVLHATSHVLLARNVGWKSIGHGFVLEEGTETDNVFRANAGIYARAAVQLANGSAQRDNPRKVPGIWAAKQPAYPPYDDPTPPNTYERVPFFSDFDHPSVFWIMNGWNTFEYNVAAGAGTCGVCYWLVPGANGGHSRHQKWEGYAAEQHGVGVNDVARAAMTPLKRFVGNYCVSAMTSFTVNSDQAGCLGVGSGPPFDAKHFDPVPNALAPDPCVATNLLTDPKQKLFNCNEPAHASADMYYPKVSGGGRLATLCDDESADATCAAVERCSNGAASEKQCAVTVLDHYTTQFNWAQTNFAAIVLRPQWSLLTHSFMSDIQNGGVSIITGGGYTHSDAINGFWAAAKKTAFVGFSQDPTKPGANKFALDLGPFNAASKLKCDDSAGNHCLSEAEGISFPLDNFANNQRFYNIYDGPSYQEDNVYLDIKRRVITDCDPDQVVNPGNCFPSESMYGRVLGMPWRLNAAQKKESYLPNAAVGWKQPNGFYYPPAFHSFNLAFDNVDIRHFVIEPMFDATVATQFKTAPVVKLKTRFATYNDAMFTGFTDVDRQTELSDDDGSLTGYKPTVSVNEDDFFNAAVEGVECESDGTAKTSPYEYLTTVVYPACARRNKPPECALLPACQIVDPPADCALRDVWSLPCSNQFCFGVPLYRQLVTKKEKASGAAPRVKMMGQNTYQRSTLSVNNGVYFVDTSTPKAAQQAAGGIQLSVFQPGTQYDVFLLFATKKTKQTYQIWIGKNADFVETRDVVPTRITVDNDPYDVTPQAQGDWPSTWQRCYNPATGILSVEVDMSFKGFADAIEATPEERCRPFSYCKWDKSESDCTCALKPDGPDKDAYKACSDKVASPENASRKVDVCHWAIKDFDCPKGGCYGFAFKLPAGDLPLAERPPATCFPEDARWKFDWASSDHAASQGIAGTACYNAAVTPNDFCTDTAEVQCPPESHGRPEPRGRWSN